MKSALNCTWWIAGGLAVLALALSWSRLITDERIDGDDLQTLTMAVDLRYHGVASLDREPPYEPSMYREPLPVVTTAVAIWLADAVLGEAGPEAYLSGDRARLLKHQNLLWVALLCLSAFWATYTSDLFAGTRRVSRAADEFRRDPIGGRRARTLAPGLADAGGSGIGLVARDRRVSDRCDARAKGCSLWYAVSSFWRTHVHRHMPKWSRATAEVRL